MIMQQRSEVFTLLDDCDSTAERRSSRLYAGFLHERSCHDAAQLDEACASVEADLHDGLHAVVLADYEFGRNLQLAQPGDAAFSDPLEGNRDLRPSAFFIQARPTTITSGTSQIQRNIIAKQLLGLPG